MSNRSVLLGGTALVLASAAAWAGASGKVPNAEDIKKHVARLYNGDVPFDSSAGREKAFVDIEKILVKDKTGLAMKTPEFWVEAIQVGRFSGKKKTAKVKETKFEDISIETADGKQSKARLWYRGGALIVASKPCPVLVTVLEKGADPKKYLDEVQTNKELFDSWVVGAIALGDEFPVAKESRLMGWPFLTLRDLFNTDANRWYLEGVGAACIEVQTAASQTMANRLAGLVLRGAPKAITSLNTALYPTLVVHAKPGDKPGPEQQVFPAYQKIDEKMNEELVVDDVPSVATANDNVVAWFTKHPLRETPTTYTWSTTFTDKDEGESWAGTLHIQTPGKRGVPTKVMVKYLKDSNTVDIQAENLGECTVYMNDQLLNLDKPVKIFANGQPQFQGDKLMERDLRKMFEIADSYSEWGRVFTAQQRVVVKNEIAAPPPDAGGKAPDGGAPPAGGNPPAGGTPPAGGNPPSGDKPK